MPEPLLTAEEFERQYAERSGMTVRGLRGLGRRVYRCRCNYEDCEGWASMTAESAAGDATVDAEPAWPREPRA